MNRPPDQRAITCGVARRAAGGAFCLLALLPLAGCGGGNQSALDPAGPQAGRISDMWWLMFWVCSAVFVLVIAFLLMAVFRRRPQGEPAAAEKTERNLTRAVTAAVAATVVILFVFLVASFLIGRRISSPPGPDPVMIKVTGYQWWWGVEYEDPLPSNIVTTANEIHIPVGHTVALKLTSRDVIHSFWVPNLHGKRDLIPGHETTLWFKADREGLFRGQCAEFCGHQHAHMAFVVVAEPPDQFYAWLDGQRRPAAQPSAPDQARGQQVFLSAPCVMCHTIKGTPAGSRVGPDLTHVASRQSIAAGTLPNTRDHLERWVLDPQSIKPGNRMPPNKLSSEDLQALLTYLESLR
jgi:cytochrome c oxidase subunit 2